MAACQRCYRLFVIRYEVAFARWELSYIKRQYPRAKKGGGLYRFLVRFAGSLLQNYQTHLTDTTNAFLVVASRYNYNQATPTRSLNPCINRRHPNEMRNAFEGVATAQSIWEGRLPLHPLCK